jgi:hypothetical protein
VLATGDRLAGLGSLHRRGWSGQRTDLGVGGQHELEQAGSPRFRPVQGCVGPGRELVGRLLPVPDGEP